MARETIITYQCEECGSEIIVTPTGETQLSPIYCCGFEVAEITPVVKKAPAPKKKVVKKAVAKVVKKKTAPKKKPAAKKKPATKKKVSRK
jgi:hypothetical protein